MDLIFFKLLTIVLVMFVALVEIFIINYLLRLKRIGCDCAVDWRRYYIMFYFFLSLIASILSIFIGEAYVSGLMLVILLIGIPNIVFILQYVNKLSRDKCRCSESVIRDVLFMIAIFQVIVFIFIFIYIVLAAIHGFIFYKSIPTKQISATISVRKIKKPSLE